MPAVYEHFDMLRECGAPADACDCCFHALATGAAVAFGLMGMAQAIYDRQPYAMIMTAEEYERWITTGAMPGPSESDSGNGRT